MAPVLAGAGLVAVPKPKGGIRPIAIREIGEILRRLTGKCLMSHARSTARVPADTEVAVHAVCSWLERHSGTSRKVLVKLDFENAFNCVSRQQVLLAAQTSFPFLARWVLDLRATGRAALW